MYYNNKISAVFGKSPIENGKCEEKGVPIMDQTQLLLLKDGEYTTFRGKPLVRDKNVICYGDMQKDSYVMLLMILTTKKVKGADGEEVELPDQIMGQIYSTDTTLDAMKRVAKNFSAKGLFEAFDYGLDYLESKNKSKKA